MINKSQQAGFSAIELLITLIIASMFLFAGYQLYSQVTRDGADANKAAIISNKVYEKLRAKALEPSIATATACSAANETTTPVSTNENVPGVGSVTYLTEVKCQNTAAALDVYRIKVTATYTDAGTTKSVEHATYVN